jgi:hypothetical protein
VRGDHSWMRPVLLALFDEFDQETVAAALRSDDDRSRLREALNRDALAAGKLGAIPEGQYGDNLLQGLLALRTKFDREMAISKLDVNLAMRQGRRQ